MPYTAIRHRQLLAMLVNNTSVPLTEVIDCFADSKGRADLAAVDEALQFLDVGDSYYLFKKGSTEPLYLSDELLENPEDYSVVLTGLEGLEINMSEDFENLLDDSELSEDGPNEFYAEIKDREGLRIIGEPDGATNLAERIRAFTHYFGFHLAARKFDVVESLLSDHIRETHSAAELEAKMVSLEKQYGPFDYFDHVELITLYNGENADHKTDNEMKLPQGASRQARRGEARFRLVAMHTPNGIMLHDYTVYLAIIEEAGRFKVCDIRWYSGY